jgi:HIV-1 Vpr-binding protein
VALPLGVDGSNLRRLRERYCIQCLASMGEYLEALGPVLRERGVDICLALLKRKSDGPVSALEASKIADVLKLVCSLLAHRRFALLFVDRGGVNTFLQVVQTPHTYTGLSLCLFALASIQAVMERVCSLPGDEVSGCMELALTLIGCTHDPARKNAALFLGSALVFKAVIDAFDTQEGLKRLLSLLRAATALRADMTTSGRQIAFHTCLAIRQFLRSHLALLVDLLKQSLKGGAQTAGKEGGGKRSYRPIDVGDGAYDSLALAVQRDRRLGPLFVKARWPALESFLDLGGPGVMLELAKARPQIQSGERWVRTWRVEVTCFVNLCGKKLEMEIRG